MIYQTFAIQEEGSSKDARLTVYIQDPSGEINIDKRPILLMCPGGGYEYVSDREAEPMAFPFLAKGFHVAILRYSVFPAVYPAALLELGRSVLLIREHAEEWHVDENAVVVQGCSAGGHLAASYACMWKEGILRHNLLSGNDRDAELLRPNGLMLCYPVITSGEKAHRGSFEHLLGDRYEELKDKMSLEYAVNGDVPRTFLWHTGTDGSVPVENSLLFVDALRKNGISTEFHMFPEGGHGLALANKLTSSQCGKEIVQACEKWIDLATAWMDGFFRNV